LKIKTRQTTECTLISYTRGKGGREGSFGALHLAQARADGLKYVCKVGGGFDEHSLRAVFEEIKKLNTIKKPIKDRLVDDARSVWVEPRLVCEVEFASVTEDGALREPVFLRLRPDLEPGSSEK
jgi:bifunctional non-homologous end joining protein LigD